MMATVPDEDGPEWLPKIRTPQINCKVICIIYEMDTSKRAVVAHDAQSATLAYVHDEHGTKRLEFSMHEPFFTPLDKVTVKLGDAARVGNPKRWSTTNSDFVAAADAQAAIEGTAANRVVASVPDETGAAAKAKKTDAVEDILRESEGLAANSSRRVAPGAPAAEPLAGLQWDMQAIGATADGSYRYERGDKRVKVAIIDTGIDGSHPDIAPNFDSADSRNFTVDIPVDANGDSIDGPCEDEPDQSCNDPADVPRVAGSASRRTTPSRATTRC
jgi:hypothetical protein